MGTTTGSLDALVSWVPVRGSCDAARRLSHLTSLQRMHTLGVREPRVNIVDVRSPRPQLPQKQLQRLRISSGQWVAPRVC